MFLFYIFLFFRNDFKYVCRRMDKLSREGRRLCQKCCLPSEKRSTLKGKKKSFVESKFFSFRVGNVWCAGKQTGSHKSCLPCKLWRKSTRCVKSLKGVLYYKQSRQEMRTVIANADSGDLNQTDQFLRYLLIESL